MIIYDIANNSIRAKIAKLLIKESYERLQLSVFIGFSNPSKNTILWQQLSQLIEEDKTAKFYIFPMPKSSIKKYLYLGNFDLDTGYLCGEKETLFI